MKTRVKKNYVCSWRGPRGGEKSRKFFTKDARDQYAASLKAGGTRGVKTSVQTRQKVAVSG